MNYIEIKVFSGLTNSMYFNVMYHHCLVFSNPWWKKLWRYHAETYIERIKKIWALFFPEFLDYRKENEYGKENEHAKVSVFFVKIYIYYQTQ